MARRRGPTTRAVKDANRPAYSAARILAGPPKVEPGFPEPFSDTPALYSTVKAVMVATEVLLRRKGDILDSAVRVRDLELLTDFYDDRYSVPTIDTGKTKGEVVPCTGDVWTDVNTHCFVGEDASNCNLTVEPGDTIQVAHCDVIYQYFGDSRVCLGSGGDGKYPHYDTVEADWVPQGSTSHTALQDREDPDSHPLASITGIQTGGAGTTWLNDQGTYTAPQGFSEVHNDLTGRSDLNTHPISAITDLEARLAALEATVQQLNQRIGACWFV